MMTGEMVTLAQCPPDYDTHPLILMSLDGFRADYLDRGLTPALKALADRGVHATYMNPTYPTLTFPNHYTIVTGLNPESHGIIANKFFDPEFYATFEIGSDESLKARWWGGEPIWNTVTDQGKKSATYFWPGSDVPINGKYPTYWVPYNWTLSFEDRVDQVLEWVSLPVDERPAWISLYLNQPDHEAHNYGPNSVEVNNELEYVDIIVDRLVQGLEVRGLTECVNLIVLADHGAAQAATQDNVIKLVDYIPNLFDLAYSYVGVFARLDPKDDSQAGEEAVTTPLSCTREGLRVYLREDLPTRHHFSNNRRIEDVVLDVDPGLTVSISYDFDDLGFHGYDNYFASMDALFVGVGPDFRQQVVVDDFHNIELYNLMCTMVGIEPAPNNGTLGSLRHFLRNPPPPPSLPQVTHSI
ncbi:hypothetical protein Pcinc_012785 [Petrolisthes cinctipes]|uniref:Alkaline phosphatase family protein n=1 Tax=Petrolisthes cinctipes TaxID=88211 RepID=A0AAE1FY67_PETCI|nr:hypothetical protein Pcinc_012785 [Petrolisthes cinctipes]